MAASPLEDQRDAAAFPGSKRPGMPGNLRGRTVFKRAERLFPQRAVEEAPQVKAGARNDRDAGGQGHVFHATGSRYRS